MALTRAMKDKRVANLTRQLVTAESALRRYTNALARVDGLRAEIEDVKALRTVEELYGTTVPEATEPDPTSLVPSLVPEATEAEATEAEATEPESRGRRGRRDVAAEAS